MPKTKGTDLLFPHQDRVNELPVEDAGPEGASRDGRDQPEQHQDLQLVVEREPGRQMTTYELHWRHTSIKMLEKFLNLNQHLHLKLYFEKLKPKQVSSFSPSQILKRSLRGSILK